MEQDNDSAVGQERQRSQTRSFAAALAGAAALVCVLAAMLPASSAGRSYVLASAINPNTATVQSLVRLPGIGPGRAEEMVALRDERGIRFDSPNDLRQVKGIGPKTVKKTSDSLSFEGGQQ